MATDVSASETERFYFHSFRQLAGEAVGIRHKHNTLFWKKIVPQYCNEVDAVKHAVIALGAAYHNYQNSDARPDRSAPPSQTERFIIKQYSLAVRGLTHGLDDFTIYRRYGCMLISCVTFFCIEVLRNDWEAALTHLSNGLQLMSKSNLPPEVVDILNNPAKWSQGNDTTYARVEYMIRLLSRWEVSTRLISGDFRPRLTLSIYETRKLESPPMNDLLSVEGLCEAVEGFCHDVNALGWLTRDHRGDSNFWVQQRPNVQRAVLQDRGHRIRDALVEYRGSTACLNLAPQDMVFLSVGILRHRGASIVLDLLPAAEIAEEGGVPSDEIARFEEFLATCINVRDVLSAYAAVKDKLRSSNVDLGVVPSIYVVGSVCRDASLRAKILGLAMDWPHRENLWDGPALRQMLDAEGLKAMPPPGESKPPMQNRWANAMPGMWF